MSTHGFSYLITLGTKWKSKSYSEVGKGAYNHLARGYGILRRLTMKNEDIFITRDESHTFASNATIAVAVAQWIWQCFLKHNRFCETQSSHLVLFNLAHM